jgi:hypothetical protein
MPQRVRPNGFGDIRAARGLTYGALHGRPVQVVTSDGAGARVPARARGRKDVLPAEICVGARVFSIERVG